MPPIAKRTTDSTAYLTSDYGRGEFWGLEKNTKYILTGLGVNEDNEKIITVKGFGSIRFLAKYFRLKVRSKPTTKEPLMAKKVVKKKVVKKVVKKVAEKATKKVVKKVAKKSVKKVAKKATEVPKSKRPKSADGLSLTQTVFKMLREEKHTDQMIGEVVTANFPDAKHNDAGIVKYHRAKHNRANPDDVLKQMVEVTVKGKTKIVEKDSHTPEEKAEPKKAAKKSVKEPKEKTTKKVVKKKVIRKKKK